MTNPENNGRLYLVGVGPGDPDLMTYRAVKVLEDSPVIIAPKASRHGNSSALTTARAQVDMQGKEIVELHFPMKKVFAANGVNQDTEVLKGWGTAAKAVLSYIDMGKDVAFPTIGDPAIYSTAFYLLATLHGMRPDIEARVIPGISAMSACSAATCQALGLGDELITVVPAAFKHENLRQILDQSETTVLMKVHRCIDGIAALLEETGLVESAVLVEKCGLPGQNIYHDIRNALNRDIHYFSTMIIRKNHREFV